MAIWVLLGHFTSSIFLSIPHIPANLSNRQAVDVFIILSGFAIAVLIDRSHEPYGIYIARRALRIFPVYWVYLSASVAITLLLPFVWQDAPAGAMKEARSHILASSISYFWPNIATHIPALHSLIPDRIIPQGEYAFLGQAWSISLEWQFYLIAPFVIPALLAARRSWSMALGLLAVFLVLAFIGRAMPMGFVGRYAIFFAIGIATHHLLNWQQTRSIQTSTIATIAIFVIGALVLLRVPSVLPISIWVAVSACVLAHINAYKSRLSQLLTSRVALWIGERSYSVYLAHMIPLTIGMNALEKAGIEEPITHAVSLLIITVLGTAALAYLSFRWIEQPFQRLGKQLSTRAQQAPA
jgi:peptidoglycan/LPS O-acetylase OafA/YrhL